MRRSSFYALTSVSLAALLLAATATQAMQPAVQILGVLKPRDQWKVGTVESEGAPYCAMVGKFDQASTLAFARSPEGFGSLGIEFFDDMFKPGKKYEVTLTLEKLAPRTFTGEATTARSLVLQIGEDEALYDTLNKSETLRVTTSAIDVRFAIAKFGKNYVKLVNCANVLAGPQEPAPLPPAHMTQAEVDAMAREELAAMPKEQAKKIASLKAEAETKPQLAAAPKEEGKVLAPLRGFLQKLKGGTDTAAKAEPVQLAEKDIVWKDDAKAAAKTAAVSKKKSADDAVILPTPKPQTQMAAADVSGVEAAPVGAVEMAAVEPAAGITDTPAQAPAAEAVAEAAPVVNMPPERKLLASMAVTGHAATAENVGMSAREMEKIQAARLQRDMARKQKEIAALAAETTETARQQVAESSRRQEAMLMQADNLQKEIAALEKATQDKSLTQTAAAPVAEVAVASLDKGEIKQQAETLAQKQAEMEKLSAAREAESRQLAENLSKTEAEFTARLDALQMERDSLKKQLDQALAFNSVVEPAVETARRESEIKLKALEAQLDDAEAARSALRRQLAEADAANKLLQESLKAQQEERAKAEEAAKQIALLQAELEQKSRQSQELAQALAEEKAKPPVTTLDPKLVEEKKQLEEKLAAIEAARKAEGERLTQMEEARKTEAARIEQLKAEREAEAKRLAQIEAERLAEAERIAKLEAERQAEAVRIAKLEEERKAEALRLAKLEEERKAEALRIAKLEEERRLEAERLAKAEADRKQEAERLAKLEEDRKAEALRLAKLEEERRAEEAARLAKIEAERAVERARLAKMEEERKAEAERVAKLEAERKAEAERIAKLEAERRLELERLAKLEAERKAEAERLAKLEEERKAEALRLAKLEEERRAEEAARLAKAEAERKAEIERLAKIEAERKAEAARLAKLEEERKAEALRIAKLEEQRRVEEAARLAKIEAERKAAQETAEKLKREAEAAKQAAAAAIPAKMFHRVPDLEVKMAEQVPAVKPTPVEAASLAKIAPAAGAAAIEKAPASGLKQPVQASTGNSAEAFLESIMQHHRPQGAAAKTAPVAPVAPVRAAVPAVPAPVTETPVAPAVTAPKLRNVVPAQERSGAVTLEKLLDQAGVRGARFQPVQYDGQEVSRQWTLGNLSGLYEQLPATASSFSAMTKDYLARYHADCPQYLTVRLNPAEQTPAGTVANGSLSCKMPGNSYETSMVFVQNGGKFAALLHSGNASDAAQVKSLGDNIFYALSSSAGLSPIAPAPAHAVRPVQQQRSVMSPEPPSSLPARRDEDEFKTVVIQ